MTKISQRELSAFARASKADNLQTGQRKKMNIDFYHSLFSFQTSSIQIIFEFLILNKLFQLCQQSPLAGTEKESHNI